jgi:hypothetical protein
VSMSGSDFTESVKREARRLAAFRCCYCRDEMGDQAAIENAILLCVRCHSLYGHRADKRAQLAQARDAWYEIVAAKYSTKTVDHLENIATKEDVSQITAEIKNIYDIVLGSIQNGSMGRQEAVNVASSMVSSLVGPTPLYRTLPAHLASSSGVIQPPLTLGPKMADDDDPDGG